MDKKIKEEYEKLIKEINYHNNLYYNEDNPEIEDYQYDALTQKLKKIERDYPELITKNSPTQNVGGVAKRTVGVEIKHKVPMLSLLDVFDEASVTEFVEKVRKEYPEASFVVEQKIDGLSLSAEYHFGKLVVASTRGNGLIGEDVTANAKNIIGLPSNISSDLPLLEVRGEVYMPQKNFEMVNLKQEENEKPLFKNARNCAAGTLRQLSPRTIKDRGLKLFIFNIQQIEGKAFTSHADGLDWLESEGFSVSPNFIKCKTEKDVLSAIAHIGKIRSSLPYGIDGAVIKVDELSIRNDMGNTAKTPRWAIAYKYPPEKKETTIRDISVQVGRTGRLTPLAIFDSVDIAGSTITKATLHNQDHLKRLNINIGDKVVIQKAGDVIPEIAYVSKKDSEGYFKLPSICPVCGARVIKMNGADQYCSSSTCPAKIQKNIEFFASKECMDISGMGPSVISALIKKGYIKNIVDIFRLTDKKNELIEKNIIGKEKTVNNLIASIEKSKNRDIPHLIKALGAKNIGLHAGEIIAKKYKTMDNICNAKYEDLVSLDGIGDVCAKSIVDFFGSENIKTTIKELSSLGVNVVYNTSSNSSGLLNNLVFVITGTLPTLKRTECKNIILQNGGKVSDSVSKTTNYLIAGEKSGSKLEKANKLGIKVLTEKEFLDLLK